VSVAPIKDTDDFNFVADFDHSFYNPSPIAQMLKATKFLSEYPYGCIEQDSEPLYPQFALHGCSLTRATINYHDSAKKELDEKTRVAWSGCSIPER